MRLFLYEWASAPGRPDSSLRAEGEAMRDALRADLQAIPGVEVVTLLDSGLSSEYSSPWRGSKLKEEEATLFRRTASRCEGTLGIAPECHGILATTCRWVHEAGGRWLGPSLSAILLATDKPRLADLFFRSGVATPLCYSLEEARRLTYPVVCKPRDGAGSQATFLLHSPEEVDACRDAWEGELFLQTYHHGIAASCAVLADSRTITALLAGRQHLSRDGRFQYQGGSLPLPGDLQARAQRLAVAAVEVLPEPRGYLGVDLILGQAEDGSEDLVLEINPRLTTSYLGLRALCQQNLGEAILRSALGDPCPPLTWRPGPIDFHVNGRVAWPSSPEEFHEATDV